MDIRLRFILIALGIIAVVVIVATLLLPRKVRLGLYIGLILIAGGAWAYVTLSRDYLPSSYAVEPSVIGLEQPTFAAAPPDDSNRLFVTGKLGVVQVVEDGEVLEKPLLDIGDRVAWEGGEQGLLSLVFHPDFGENGFFYLYYTAKPDDRTVLSRMPGGRHCDGC